MPATAAAPEVAIAPLPRASSRSFVAPLVAAALALVAALLGWRGVDLPAQIYRVALFHKDGLTLWDSQWYGGHWTFDYSVIFPPIAAFLGVTLTGIVSATLAAWAFDRLAVSHFGHTARVGSVLFAVGTVVQVAIGQLPFLMGEALALAACCAAARRRWLLAVLLAVATSLASPLAAAFLGLAAVAWLLAGWPKHRVGIIAVIAGIAIPIGVVALLFPGQGSFPYPAPDFVWEAVTCLGLLLLVPKQERALRMAAWLYVFATAASFLLPTPVGGNIGRLGEIVGVPLLACLLWPIRRSLMVVLAIPMMFWEWTPAVGAMTTNARQPSTHAAYYAPLVEFLQAHRFPLGRVEVVPTADHWEAAYVAPAVPLARGWERQLDTGDNPLFYDIDELNIDSYYGWLIDNGVRYVALPAAPLDYAGVAEARLIEHGVPELTPVWHNADWRVFAVAGSTGIVDGPAVLNRLDGGHIDLTATAPGTVLVRVHDNPNWSVVRGAACASPTADRWMAVRVDHAGDVALQLTLRRQPACS